MFYVLHHIIVGICFLSAYFLFEAGIPSEFVLASITGLSIIFLLIGEHIMPDQKEVRSWRDPQAPNDIAHFVTYGLIRKYIIGGSVLTLIQLWPGGLLGVWPYHWPFVLQFVLLLFLWEAVSYWRHRLQHNVSYLWPMHAVHHDTPQMHTLKAVRVHFLDDIFSFSFELMVPLIFGGPVEVYLGVLLWNVVFGNLTHANIKQKNPNWLQYILPTVQLHVWHHSQAGMHQNMAGVLPAIDMMFGTYMHPSRFIKTELGLGEYKMPKGFFGQLWHPVYLLIPSPR